MAKMAEIYELIFRMTSELKNVTKKKRFVPKGCVVFTVQKSKILLNIHARAI